LLCDFAFAILLMKLREPFFVCPFVFRIQLGQLNAPGSMLGLGFAIFFEMQHQTGLALFLAKSWIFPRSTESPLVSLLKEYPL